MHGFYNFYNQHVKKYDFDWSTVNFKDIIVWIYNG